MYVLLIIDYIYYVRGITKCQGYLYSVVVVVVVVTILDFSRQNTATV
jgi:hypothetical protein